MTDPRAVAVTGIGVATAAGLTVSAFWDGLCAGRSLARRIRGFDASGLPVSVAAEVDLPEDAGAGRAPERFTALALSAARSAWADAGFVTPDDAARVGVAVGCGFAGMGPLETAARDGLVGGGRNRLPPSILPRVMPNAPGAAISMALGLRGPNLTYGTVCAAGAHAIGEAVQTLRAGAADVMLAGGADAPVTPFVIRGFSALTALSRHDDPGCAARPFSADREGFVLGEGSAFLVLERAADARARGARTYAWIVGYGATADAHDLVMPAPDGGGAAACMRAALADARLGPGEVAHVNAHGTATRRNDAAEAAAIRTCLGRADAVPITSCKATLGHLMGAAGAVEAAALALTLQLGAIPPTAATREVDPGLGVDLVLGAPRRLGRGSVALTSSFAFGGQNACLAMAAP